MGYIVFVYNSASVLWIISVNNFRVFRVHSKTRTSVQLRIVLAQSSNSGRSGWSCGDEEGVLTNSNSPRPEAIARMSFYFKIYF